MFKDRLTQIFTVIGATSADIARSAGCDHSNVSRIASGARVPKPGGVGASRLVRGICSYAESEGATGALALLVGCPEDAPAPTLSLRTMAWLYEDLGAEQKGSEARGQVPFRAFGEKLTAVMDLCGLSNVRLGRLINVDTSYVSRFKNGLRSPRSNPRTMEDICRAITKRTFERGKCRELAALMKRPATDNCDELYPLLYSWLFDDELDNPEPDIERLLEDIDTFIPQSVVFPSVGDDKLRELAEGTEAVYFGRSGLQRAVLRFLASAILQGEQELYLYSEQNISWMTDPEYRSQWLSLMLTAVRRGFKIHIIHNVDRDVEEMISAINSWLPLYMSGSIGSYYLRKERSTRFSTTFFLCPGVACIKGTNAVRAGDDDGDYRYDTDPELLGKHFASFSALLSEAKSLVSIETKRTLPELGGDTVYYFGSSPSIATLPPETLSAILSRCGIDGEARQAAEKAGKEARSLLSGITGRMPLTEFIPSADDDELYSGRLPIDLPGVSAFYTPEEYSEHIRYMIDLMGSCPNYRICPLPDSPFPNMRILISDSFVTLNRMNEPNLTFRISHPALCDAFISFASGIASRYLREKRDTEEYLARYL